MSREPLFCSLDDAAQILGVSRRTIERLIDRGQLQAHRKAFGRQRFVKRRDVERLGKMQPEGPRMTGK